MNRFPPTPDQTQFPFEDVSARNLFESIQAFGLHWAWWPWLQFINTHLDVAAKVLFENKISHAKAEGIADAYSLSVPDLQALESASIARTSWRISDGVMSLIAACRLLKMQHMAIAHIKADDASEFWKTLHSMERTASVMHIARNASKRGKAGGDARAASDTRAADGIAMYLNSKQKWKSAASAAECIAPQVGLSVEVMVKHLRKVQKNTKKADAATLGTDST